MFITELVWTLAFLLLLTGLVLPLLRRKPVVVPVVAPLAFLAAEIVALQWLWQDGWTGGARWTALICFVFVGLVLIYQSFGKRRWFIFRGGGFYRDNDTYDALALCIRQTLQEENLPPATVICRLNGRLGLSPLTDAQQKRLFAHLDDALENTRWRRFGPWQWFFGLQWAILCLTLVLQYVLIRGGF